MHAHRMKVRPLELEVAPLPTEGRPDSFNGAVGLFSMKGTVNPPEVAVGEPVNVRVEIGGKGNLDAVVSPSWASTPSMKAYEMKLVDSQINDEGTLGRRYFEQVVIPRGASFTELPPLAFSFFNTDSMRYEEVRIGPFPLTVKDDGGGVRHVVGAGEQGTASGGKTGPSPTPDPGTVAVVATASALEAHARPSAATTPPAICAIQ